MDKKIIIYIIASLLVLGLLLLTFFPELIHAWKDSRNFGEDICAPPPGQTLESWKEHMSHHPNIYAKCLT